MNSSINSFDLDKPENNNVSKCDSESECKQNGQKLNIENNVPSNCLGRSSNNVNSSNIFISATVIPIKDSLSHLTRLDDFNVIKLSQGFFSEVFKVTHKSTRKVMVLKMNKQGANRGNALKETELLNKLNHPNIVAFMGTVVHEGQVHPLLEYLNGNTLEKLIRKFYHPSVLKHLTVESSLSNKLKVEENVLSPWAAQSCPGNDEPTSKLFCKLAKDVAHGMRYLHQLGYIHRDLTSKNILLRGRGNLPIAYMNFEDLTAVIADFGFATTEPSLGDPKLPTAGTPYWLAPECLRGLWYNHKCDIFSFGIICCELNWRIPADPDFLPRDNLFNIIFRKLSPLRSETTLAQIAQLACNENPSCRPEFSEIIDIFDSLDNNIVKKSENNLNHELMGGFEQKQEEVGDVFDKHLIRRRNSMFSNVCSFRNSTSPPISLPSKRSLFHSKTNEREEPS